MWKQQHKTETKAYNEGTGPDPGMGVFWIAQGEGESLPQSDKP